METHHVYPIEDLKPHTTSSDYCACQPRVDRDTDGTTLVIHNSYDGREFWEQEIQERGH